MWFTIPLKAIFARTFIIDTSSHLTLELFKEILDHEDIEGVFDVGKADPAEAIQCPLSRT